MSTATTNDNLTVLPMTEADIPLMTALLHKAYYSPTGAGISGLLYHAPPSQSSLDKTTAQRLHAFRTDPAAHFVKVVDCTSNAGNDDSATAAPAIIACARWDIPRRHGHRPAANDNDDDDDQLIPDDELIPEFRPAVYRALFGPLRAAHAELMGARPHAHLATLVTDPDEGRRGAGGMLVRWGLERADAEGLEAYVDASPAGEGLYARSGFEVVRRVGFDLGRWGGGEGVVEHVCMWRKPGPSPRKIVAA
ncbi:acyl-n-acyltransferase [Diplodia corticola]|uniref:Acyl-n-acyltransferase n=1 Tax=Diplodia corticola TaxID=236234 RepID=A0A1J9R3M1_9PEZI|nr:acyl-n-acyltransferase [Diplodia corticola]OJD35177.1 acyl-n-acyltransferase [Diplodia corticola]